jgi:ATP-dependent DNA ligase
VTLPIPQSYAPMEALLVNELPRGEEWQYEPKWDGFRCLVHRDGDSIELMSKAGKPLARYFPDLVETIRAISATRFVMDGEIVIPHEGALSFDELLMRIHPAASRVKKLAAEHPATLIAFDLLVDAKGDALVDLPLSARREALEAFMGTYVPSDIAVHLSPSTTAMDTVTEWFRSVGGGLDGVIAKQRDLAYQTGNRHGMKKMKAMRTADCVVGGFRYASKGKVMGSLLLGLYDDGGLLHHVGFTSNVPNADKAAVTTKLEAIIDAPGFTGQAPGGPSRWSTERSAEWQALTTKLVVEVKYDHFSGGRFRHGTSFLRWRPDKEPRQCTIEQVEQEGRSALKLLT